MSILSKIISLFIPKSLPNTTSAGMPRAAPTRGKESPGISDFRLKGSKLNSLKIAGTMQAQDALRAIAGGNSEFSANARIRVIVEEEDNNIHDSNAVKISFQGNTLGYLSRKDAKTYRADLARHGLKGKKGNASADIVGGWIDDDSSGHFGLRLRCDWPIQPDSTL